MESPQRDSDEVLHQSAVEDVVDERVDATVDEHVDEELVDISEHGAIDDLDTPSNAYVEAEAVATADTVNEILAVLRDAGLIPPSEEV